MRLRALPAYVFSLLLVAAACGGGEPGDGNPDAAPPGTPDAASDNPDAGIPAGFTTLISRSWTIPAGQEIYRCTRVTVQEDMYINTFRSLSPIGTHHTVLSLHDDASRPDGDYNCGAGDIAHSMLFASGIGTDDLSFPEGVAIPIRAGQQLDLNLHLYNFSESEIQGESGTLGRLIPVGEVQDEAEVVFGGKAPFAIPNDPQNEQTLSGGCQFNQAGTVVALWPHMHQYGVHMRIVHQSGNGDVVLHDGPFDFNEQLNYVIDPVEVAAGERLAVDCTYLNDSGSLIFFGDSSESEMCFAGIYRYPATGAGTFDCVEF